MTEQTSATLNLPTGPLDLPVITGTENETAVDITKLRAQTGCITYDGGYGNTGSCISKITYINGEEGILRYRGYPIEQIAEKCSFLESSYLLTRGHLPNQKELDRYTSRIQQNLLLHEGLRYFFEGFPPTGHPMAMLSAMINATSCYHPELLDPSESEDVIQDAGIMLLAKVLTIACFTYKKSVGQPVMYPDPEISYEENFLHMMFSLPYARYEPEPEVVEALRLFLILHADHEQNCSTSTVRMVGSSGANLFASASAGVGALWGPLHGGANMGVIQQLKAIHAGGENIGELVEKVKRKEFRLMGFGHRVYKSFDPRAKILKVAAKNLLDKLGVDDPLLDIAQELEHYATHDDYFVSRGLYPNVDFYSGIILRTLGIPLNMFTVMFAIGRMPGWIANWIEQHDGEVQRICRPRQVYTGEALRDVPDIADRD